MQLLEEHRYEKKPVQYGYANRTLHIDVGTRAITEKPVTDRMKEIFVGGRGFDLWLLWNAIPPRTRWDDPVNEVVIASGPLAGSPIYPGSGKSIPRDELTPPPPRRAGPPAREAIPKQYR